MKIRDIYIFKEMIFMYSRDHKRKKYNISDDSKKRIQRINY
jgi:hypothetical protein